MRERLVWVTSNASATPRTGATLRTHRLLQATAEEFETHVVCVAHEVDAQQLAATTGAVSVQSFPSTQQGWALRLTAARRRWPVRCARTWSPQAAAAVRALGDETLVVLDHVDTLPYRPEGRPFVLSTHNAEAEMLRDRPKGLGPRDLELRLETRRLARAERAVARDPRAHLVVVSELDKVLLDAPTAVIVPNGTELPSAVPGLPVNGTVLFVASLDYPPNSAAVTWWAREVAPLLPASFPPLTVVGRGGDALAGLTAIDLVGEVADVEPHLARASVVAIPLLHGGGTRLKLLEALAHGRPVVSTSKGAEGIDLVPGRDLLVADTPRAFADAVVRARSDSELAADLARHGRESVMQYGWDLVGRQLVAVLQRAARQGSSR